MLADQPHEERLRDGAELDQLTVALFERNHHLRAAGPERLHEPTAFGELRDER